MRISETTEPKKVLYYFEEISKIPHGSGNTEKISLYLEDFAKERELEYYRDALGNIMIVKEASAGYEKSEPVIIQGHMDMVCEKAPDCTKDMEKEGLDLMSDGEYIYAEGTTLGGDDGIAVAMALAMLDDENAQHPKLEVIMTIDEEMGMIGAEGIDVSPLSGKKMINIDTENEGVFTVSCAGGNVTKCILPISYEAAEGDGLEIKISGLVGGHSGVEIDKGRANANMLLGRVLFAISEETDMRISSVCGGFKDNAICVEAFAKICVSDREKAKETVKSFENIFKNEYAGIENDLSLSANDCDMDKVMKKECSENAMFMLVAMPNGIQAMSNDIEGLVQTSLNLGILKTFDDRIEASFCVRSSVESQKEMLTKRLLCFMKNIGGSIEVSGDYPGWQYMKNSSLRDICCEVYNEQYGCMPKIEAIHAGLECGMFSDKIKGLDCISFGPEILDIHTYRERLNIASVVRTWDFLKEVIRRMK